MQWIITQGEKFEKDKIELMKAAEATGMYYFSVFINSEGD